MRRNGVPVECRELLNEVGGRGVAELPVAAELLELVEERVGFPRIQRVSKLPDQIGRLNEPRLESGLIRVRIRRGKARKLDRGGDTIGIDCRRFAEPLVNE